MRRKDREVNDFNELLSIIEKCDVCRVGLNDNGYPYIVPLNFGVEVDGEKVTLYFHSAKVGHKLDLIQNDSRASFEMDCGHNLISDEEKGDCTMEYECIMGRGQVSMVPDNEVVPALNLLMSHYHKEEFKYDDSFVPHTRIFKIEVSEMTGKRLKHKK